MRRCLIVLISAMSLASGACAGERSADDWHGSGWLGTAWGASDWKYAFRRDPVVGVYGAYAYRRDPYAAYRNDNGCFRILPVETPHGPRMRRVFVCDF